MSRWCRNILLGHEINNGETTYTHLGVSERSDRVTGMGGGSSISSRRTSIGQGKRVTRSHEVVWNVKRIIYSLVISLL